MYSFDTRQHDAKVSYYVSKNSIFWQFLKYMCVGTVLFEA